MISPSAHWPTLCSRPKPTTAYQPAWLRSLGPYVRRSPGLLLFLPSPQPVSRSGRNPRRCSGIGWLITLRPPNPYTVLLTSSEACGLSGQPSPTYPHIRLNTECLLSIDTENLQTGGCSWLLTSNLYRLPLAFTVDQGAQLGARGVDP
jgi:hypothetical protein